MKYARKYVAPINIPKKNAVDNQYLKNIEIDLIFQGKLLLKKTHCYSQHFIPPDFTLNLIRIKSSRSNSTTRSLYANAIYARIQSWGQSLCIKTQYDIPIQNTENIDNRVEENQISPPILMQRKAGCIQISL